mmetsp:Transcript_28584/g.91097  ORF Transcript_28584/g.91097 Transcript_28584/m.91097 type:complete len:202 (-) Transcript_28584:108-713(-)
MEAPLGEPQGRHPPLERIHPRALRGPAHPKHHPLRGGGESHTGRAELAPRLSLLLLRAARLSVQPRHLFLALELRGARWNWLNAFRRACASSTGMSAALSPPGARNPSTSAGLITGVLPEEVAKGSRGAPLNAPRTTRHALSLPREPANRDELAAPQRCRARGDDRRRGRAAVRLQADAVTGWAGTGAPRTWITASMMCRK